MASPSPLLPLSRSDPAKSTTYDLKIDPVPRRKRKETRIHCWAMARRAESVLAVAR
uniref:Uncharacterized protein n=1 Tax=Arundo donax TaxID=35708 RepID=A0A0A8Z069_ARUDO